MLDVAKGFGPTAHLVVLLGGEAGLRGGEMIGLEWGDVDLVKRQLCAESPTLARARMLYNAADYEGAIDAAAVVRKDPQ